jgi:hypothetical protein
MSPHYLWLTESLELLALLVGAPVLGLVLAYRGWKNRSTLNAAVVRRRCIAYAGIAVLLFALAKWLNADVRSPLFLLQVASFVLSILLFGLCTGYGFSLLLCVWRWHDTSRLR